MNLVSVILIILSNALAFGVELLQIIKLKRELKKANVIINNTTELKNALKKPLEGIWRIHGKFKKYHNIRESHNSNGFAVFEWNDAKKRYDVRYVYSVKKHNGSKDIVTAACSGFAQNCPDGNVKNKITLHLTTDNRCSSDGSETDSVNFVLESCAIRQLNSYITTIQFSFITNESNGIISFER
ncbi:MAG: hypothetical protein ACI3VQ_08880 [Faecousia sp.]